MSLISLLSVNWNVPDNTNLTCLKIQLQVILDMIKIAFISEVLEQLLLVSIAMEGSNS